MSRLILAVGLLMSLSACANGPSPVAPPHLPYDTWYVGLAAPQHDEMVKPERVFCKGSKRWIEDYRDSIALGMAPGGIVKVWVGGACLGYTEVGRFKAEIEPRGPFLSGRGIYYREPKPEAKAWIEKNGIPYGSW